MLDESVERRPSVWPELARLRASGRGGCSTSSGRRACAHVAELLRRAGKTQQDAAASSPRRSRAGDARGAVRRRLAARSSPRTTSRARSTKGYAGLADTQQALDLRRPSRSTSTTRASSTCAWSGSAARCSPRSPTTSARTAWPTWPTSSAARWRCCATASCRAGCRSGSTRASRHLLIDEFQDTSPLQWHALHAWLSAYAGAGGGASGQRPPGVFIVGDPKQSIYRFRRAEPRVFEAAARFVREGLERQRPGLRPHAPQRARR